MTAARKDEIKALAQFLGMAPEHVYELAQMAAGDAPLRSLDDLTDEGAAEVLANMRLAGRIESDFFTTLAAT